MSEITLQSASLCEATVVSNTFIDEYMPRAGGEFVKVYLYLLRMLQQAPSAFSLARGADTLNCTEGDILRALKYWSQEGLLTLQLDQEKTLTGICLQTPSGKKDAPSAPLRSETPAAPLEPSAPECVLLPAMGGLAGGQPAPGSSETVTADDLKQLLEDEEFRQLVFVAETYLGRTLSPTDRERIAYFYEKLHLSCELIEYLIEYCVSKEKRNIRYIEKIALAWAQKGISTVQQAKAETSGHLKKYYSILKALGLQNRNPVPAEIALMDTWTKEYGFTEDIIAEACTRTVLQTGGGSIQYADGILKDWQKKGVHTLADIGPLDAAHKRRSAKKAPSRKAPAANGNRFNNFQQRTYDYEEYERQLLNR